MYSKKLINEICAMRDENRRMVDALSGLYLKIRDKKFRDAHDKESLSAYVMDVVKKALNEENRNRYRT